MGKQFEIDQNENERQLVTLTNNLGVQANIGQYASIDTNGYTSNLLAVASHNLAYSDGSSTYERWRNNTEGVLLARGNRTTFVESPTFINYNARGIQVRLIVHSEGTGGLNLFIGGRESTVGNGYWLLQGSQIVGNGVYTFHLYPSTIEKPTPFKNGLPQMVGGTLPRRFYVTVVPDDSSVWDYAVDYSLIL